MDITFRAYNDGLSFPIQTLQKRHDWQQKISKELTTFNIPHDPDAWLVDYGGYSSPQESEFLSKN